MFNQKIVSLICKKSKINYILFSSDFKIIDFDENISLIADDANSLELGTDLRECFWEYIGNEENILQLLDNEILSFKIPMIFKNSIYYDIEIEYIQEENIFISYITTKAKFEDNYLQAIQILNKNTLISQIDKKKIDKNTNCYNLINQNVIRFHVDLDGLILEVNSICTYFLAKDENELIGKHFSDFFQSRKSKLNEENKIFNATNFRGESILFHANIIPIHRDSKVTENIIICQDVTHLKRIEQELDYASSHDSLTGLVNRSFILKKIDEIIPAYLGTNKTFTLCFIEIDAFEEILQNYGFHAGDMLLKHVSYILNNFIRSHDIVSRIANNEYVILFQEIDNINYIKNTIQRVQELPKNSPLVYNESDTIYFNFNVTTSSFPQQGRDAKTLMDANMRNKYEK